MARSIVASRIELCIINTIAPSWWCGIALNNKSRLTLKRRLLPKQGYYCLQDALYLLAHPCYTPTCCLKWKKDTSGLYVRWWPPKPPYLGYIYISVFIPRRSVPRQDRMRLWTKKDATLLAWVLSCAVVRGNLLHSQGCLFCYPHGHALACHVVLGV